MNPFVPVFIVLGIVAGINHLIGNLIPEIEALVSMLIFFIRYIRWKDIKDLEGEEYATKLIFYKRPGFWIFWAVLVGFTSIITTLIRTYGILK